MKRITALALALFMVMSLFICSGFTLRDSGKTAEPTPEPTKEPGTEEKEAEEEADSEEKPIWYIKSTVSQDDFGDSIFWDFVSSTIETKTNRNKYYESIDITTDIIPAKIALTTDTIEEPVFRFSFVYTSSYSTDYGKDVFTDSTITMKIKALNKEYQADLIGLYGGYFLINDSVAEELYTALVSQLEEGETVRCAVISDSMKLQFEIDGNGYSEAITTMDENNKQNEITSMIFNNEMNKSK